MLQLSKDLKMALQISQILYASRKNGLTPHSIHQWPFFGMDLLLLHLSYNGRIPNIFGGDGQILTQAATSFQLMDKQVFRKIFRVKSETATIFHRFQQFVSFQL